MNKTEAIRRQRLGDHYKYLRGRYPDGLPEADDGREHLYELLLAISLATSCYRKMKRCSPVRHQRGRVPKASQGAQAAAIRPIFSLAF
jgi:hypothetical protein